MATSLAITDAYVTGRLTSLQTVEMCTVYYFVQPSPTSLKHGSGMVSSMLHPEPSSYYSPTIGATIGVD